MKATDLLRSQHGEIGELLRRFDRNFGAPEIDPMLRELATALGAHLVAEREIFYPECADALNDRDVIRPCYRHQAELVDRLRRLAFSNGDEDSLRALAREVESAFREHIEEERELYPKIEPLMGDKRLEDVGGEMEARYDEGVEQGFEPAIAEGVVDEADLDRIVFQRVDRATYRTMPMTDEDTAVRKNAPAAVRHTAAGESPDKLPTGRRTKPNSGAEGARRSHPRGR